VTEDFNGYLVDLGNDTFRLIGSGSAFLHNYHSLFDGWAFSDQAGRLTAQGTASFHAPDHFDFSGFFVGT
jgi:hypothetical protein